MIEPHGTPEPERSELAGGLSLHVEHLVIEGMSSTLAPQVGRAVQLELRHLLEREGLGAGLDGYTVPSLTAPGITLPGPGRPEDLGRRVAYSVHRAMVGGIPRQDEAP